MKNQLLLSVVFLLPILAYSQEKLTIDAVNIFENGTSLLEKSIEIDASSGQYVFEELPFVQHPKSQYWILAPNNEILLSKLSPKTITQTEIAEDLATLFQKNLGKVIRVNDDIKGVLKMYDDDALVIVNADKWSRISIDDVKSFEIANGVPTTYETTATQNVLELMFKNKSEKQKLKIMSLQKGITWTPNYFLEKIVDNTMKLTLTAKVTNNLVDLENVDLNFIVNNPFLKNDLFPEQYAELVHFPLVENGDFTFIQKKGLTLKVGETIDYVLLETEVKSEDFFVTELDPSHYDPNDANFMSKSDKNIVWSSSRFKIQSNDLLPNGTVFFFEKDNGNNNLSINQSQIEINPQMLNHAVIKMAQVTDVLVTNSEKVVRRDLDVMVVNSYGENTMGELITVEGSFEIKNDRNEPIKMEVERIITGKLPELNQAEVQASDVQGLPIPVNSFNQKILVKWTIDLKPLSSERITYSYQVYVK